MNARPIISIVAFLLVSGVVGCEVVTPSDPPTFRTTDLADAGIPNAGIPDAGTTRDGGDELPTPVAGLEAIVDFVVDGDTLQVKASGRTFRIRVWGINTPEVGKPFYNEATQAARAFLPSGSKVTLGFDDAACAQADVPQSCRDIYNRVLAYVANQAGSDLGAHQLRNGLARVYGRCECSRLSTYSGYESLARAQSLGIWQR